MKTFLLAYESVIETLRPSMKVAGLTEPQWRVLHELRARSPMIASELAANTFVRASSLSRILRDLEARDLIARAQQFEDLRKTLVSLTDYGRKTIAPIEAAYAELGQRIADAVGREGVLACASACAGIVEQIGAQPGDD
ncbi:MarR family transcriptional regulator [Pleomorphomonas sp. JP5]|uniref:MarR family transcriptional regulator n=1 Tax=Pleomorphomonas sp. JP5 TaxID=2942998 RepID=UPI002042F005|nr:MarR family transcriptional regulator [Pleomorphomonas sp. JP5]MCM5557780.1 MarR family transcriptional regulator [Pleomorphomonas sp. JP5]